MWGLNDILTHSIAYGIGEEEGRAKAEREKKASSNWHTGTPTEEGWYLLYISKPYASYHLAFYQFGHWFSTDEYCIVREDVVAWMPITPYEEKGDGHTD